MNQLKALTFIWAALFFLSTSLASQYEKFDPYTFPAPKVVKWQLKNGKKLIYIGTHHTTDIHSCIHNTIKKVFDSEKPDFYVIEGFNSGSQAIPANTILNTDFKNELLERGKCSETLYGAYQASLYDIPVLGADPAETEYLPYLKGYTMEDLVFYIVCQQIPSLHNEGDFMFHATPLTKDNFHSMVTNFIQEHIAGWLKIDLKLDANDFLRWWQQTFNKPYDFNHDLLWPEGTQITHSNSDPNALKTQQIAWHINQVRDKYIVDQIKQTMKNFHTVVVIYGAYHLQQQYSALVQEYGLPISEEVLNSPFLEK